jgi:hypothetical protein
MSRGYIYIISFNDDSNNIYIGKTTLNIFKRLKHHKNDKHSSVYQYVNTYLNDDWSKVNIDIIDSIDMTIDLTYLIDHPDNIIKNLSGIHKYIYTTNNEVLNNKKLSVIENFHIYNYYYDKNYNLINKKINPNKYIIYQYQFFMYSKVILYV